MWFSNLLILKTHEDHIKIWYGEDSDIYTDGSCRKQCQTFISGDMWCTWEPDAFENHISHDTTWPWTDYFLWNSCRLLLVTYILNGYMWTPASFSKVHRGIVSKTWKPEYTTLKWHFWATPKLKEIVLICVGKHSDLLSCRELDNKVDALPCLCVKYEAEQDWILATEMCGGKTGGCITYCISLSYDVQKC